MEETNVKKGFWSEYFKSLCDHPARTTFVTIVVVDGVIEIVRYAFGRNSEH